MARPQQELMEPIVSFGRLAGGEEVGDLHVKASQLKGIAVPAASGKLLPTPFHSICVHGDNAHAVATAAAVRAGLAAAGHRLCTLPALFD